MLFIHFTMNHSIVKIICRFISKKILRISLQDGNYVHKEWYKTEHLRPEVKGIKWL